MSSTRLSGKVLLDLGGASTLELLLRRLRRCRELDRVVVATSEGADDEPIATEAARLGAKVVRGPLDDVLERYRLVATGGHSDAIVRLTADCPLMEPEVVDRLVGVWRRGSAAYVANVFEPRTYPDGVDVEVISTEALLEAAEEASERRDREHVTTFIRERPDRYPAERVDYEVPGYGELRLTLDTEADLRVIREVVRRGGLDVGLKRMIEIATSPPQG